MIGFVNKFLTKREGKGKYNDILKEYLADGKLDAHEKQELEKLAKEYGLSSDELLDAHKKASSIYFQNITSDSKITEEEKQALNELTSYFGVKPEDYKFDQKAFNKFYTLGLIDKGILPEIKNHDIDIVFKKGEILHWGYPAAIKKYKKVTQRISYRGPTASIKIMKGLRYRIGSVKVATESSEFLITEDSGAFWLTNQRIGFKGSRKNFAFPYSKIQSFELTGAGLEIAKEGKEVPYIISMDDYDVPCLIISNILNAGKE